MRLIDFIDLGWHTVPLRGELKRLDSGKKTIPVFPADWKNTFTLTVNKEDADIGGVLTGKVSDIIAIDCDNTATYNLFKALDPSYAFIFVSNGKRNAEGVLQESGTIIYKYHPKLDESFRVHNNELSIDFLSNGAFSYLPTDENETKEKFDLKGKELKQPPSTVISLLNSIKPNKFDQNVKALKQRSVRNHLAPQVAQFVKTKKINKDLFRVLTPNDFRDVHEYLNEGYLHPDNVPDGRGSEYLSKVSAILGADDSISPELYVEAMLILNELFSEPMLKVRLQSTIIDPMVEGRSRIGDETIWKFDENWQTDKVNLITKRNEYLEGFYDPERMQHFLVNVADENVKAFSSDQEFYGYVDTVTIEPPAKNELRKRLPLINVVSSPAFAFGFFADKANGVCFNKFASTVPLTILRSPDSYAKNYKKPEITLKYLSTLVPDAFMRNYLIRFIKRKLTRFEYSPVILYFLGASGSGKDTFVRLLRQFVGASGLSKPTTKEFLEVYNGWMLDKYFVQLDEYGDQLARQDDKDAAKGKIKAYTGSQEVTVREMRENGFNYEHNITFIMTANRNPLTLDEDDRRVALFSCPNVLRHQDWVNDEGGISAVQDKIFAEINNFAYYLATQVDEINADDYTTPPYTEEKQKLICDKLPASQKIAFFLANKMFLEFETLCKDFNISGILDDYQRNRIYEEDLLDLYLEMTDGKGNKRGLSMAMKNFDKQITTRKGNKVWYYVIPGLFSFNPVTFSEVCEEEQPSIKL